MKIVDKVVHQVVITEAQEFDLLFGRETKWTQDGVRITAINTTDGFRIRLEGEDFWRDVIVEG